MLDFDIADKHDGQTGGEKDDGGGHVADGHATHKEQHNEKEPRHLLQCHLWTIIDTHRQKFGNEKDNQKTDKVEGLDFHGADFDTTVLIVAERQCGNEQNAGGKQENNRQPW